MDYYRAFPFFMGYQGYGQWARPGMISEERILEDLEYLQQMYPDYSKRYQSIISSVIDKMDYDNSFIYDEYPDKFTIQRMVAGVMNIIKTNDNDESVKEQLLDDTGSNAQKKSSWNEKEPWIRELVTVLMYYEILARRRRRNKNWKNVSF